MTTLFISDLHLAGDRPEVTALLLRFLSERVAQANTLYILGDLFEVWLGDDLVLPEYLPVMEALRGLTSSGVPIFVQHGNRDFLLGEGFAAATGCQILPEPATITLGQRRALLEHGDRLCTDDRPYQEMRARLRHPQFIAAFLTKPPAERIAFARELRERSRAETSLKDTYSMDVNAEAVTAAFRDHDAALLIHGHVHRPAIHREEVDGLVRERIVLGDWGDTGSVLVCDGEQCRLERCS